MPVLDVISRARNHQILIFRKCVKHFNACEGKDCILNIENDTEKSIVIQAHPIYRALHR